MSRTRQPSGALRKVWASVGEMGATTVRSRTDVLRKVRRALYGVRSRSAIPNLLALGRWLAHAGAAPDRGEDGKSESQGCHRVALLSPRPVGLVRMARPPRRS